MNRKIEILENLLKSSQSLNTYYLDGVGLREASDRFDIWVNQVALSLKSAGMNEEFESWKQATENRVFKPENTILDIDGTNYESDLNSMRAILIGMLEAKKHIGRVDVPTLLPPDSQIEVPVAEVWPPIESLLFELDSDAVQDIISCAGLSLDWQLSKAEAYSHKTRKRAYRGRLSRAFAPLSEERKEKFVETVVGELLSRDERTRDRIRSIFEGNQSVASTTISNDKASGISTKKNSQIAEPKRMEKVFIIHGHDEELKRDVQLLISRSGLDDVVLHEKSDRGRNIIDKLIEEGKDAAYVVALLSPDDALSDGTRRARQNVVFEIGYFLGKLGKIKVRLLKKGDVEIPSDLQGILYTEYGPDGAWKMKLLKEIKDAGIDIDLNKAFDKF